MIPGEKEQGSIDFNGLTFEERLNAVNLLQEYNACLGQNDKLRLTEIMQQVGLDETDIEVMLCKAGIY